MGQQTPLLVLRYFFIDFFGGIVAFPVWWYTRGFALLLAWAGRSVRGQFVSLGLGVWIKNLFVPMYGATDIWGKVISFAIRLVMIVARTAALIGWVIIVFVCVVLYLVSLPLAIAGSLYHLGASAVHLSPPV